MASKINETEGHRLHLKALARQEQNSAYRRHDYLSHDWQMSLWRDEVKGAMQVHSLDKTMEQQRMSPSSIMMPLASSIPEAPSEICIRWREKIIEWKYQVIDRFGKAPFHLLDMFAS